MVSGGVSGVISEVCVFPIDVLALRMKVSLASNVRMKTVYKSIVKNGMEFCSREFVIVCRGSKCFVFWSGCGVVFCHSFESPILHGL